MFGIQKICGIGFIHNHFKLRLKTMNKNKLSIAPLFVYVGIIFLVLLILTVFK